MDEYRRGGMPEFLESDWRIFRKKLPGWQEACMERLLEQYRAVIADETKSAAERFWEVEGRIKRDRRSPGVCVDVRRSRMHEAVLGLLYSEVITLSDLAEFSEPFREQIGFFVDTHM